MSGVPESLTLAEGGRGLPAIVFIHGLGLDKCYWLSPADCLVLSGTVPMAKMLHGYTDLRTPYHLAMDAGLTVAAWSQKRPVGPAAEAVDELREVLGHIAALGYESAILVSHSRGGLIARSALGGQLPLRVRALLTLCTPHGGSELALWASRVSEIAERIGIHPADGKTVTRRVIRFLESPGVGELLPGSDFIRSLPPELPAHCEGYSWGGTSPTLIKGAVLSLPDAFAHIIPHSVRPKEIERGMGDGLVSRERAVMPGALAHAEFNVNHAAIAVDPEARLSVTERILRLAGLMP